MYKKNHFYHYTTLFVYIHDLPASKLSGALWWRSRKRNGQHKNNFHTFNTISHILAMTVSNLCPRTIPYWFKIKDSFMLLHIDPQIVQPANAPISPDSSPVQGWIQEFLMGGGGPNFGSEWTVLGLFLQQITSPPYPLPPVAVAHYQPSCRRNCRSAEKTETTT